jgi:hypothetical protein
MPVHDWTRVDTGLFHAFHQNWVVGLCNGLNAGVLPRGYFALLEQNVHGPIPDVLTLDWAGLPEETGADKADAGVAVTVAPPLTRHVIRTEADIYARKADHITVRHRHGQVVAVVEIVSPGNKASRNELQTFAKKAADLLRQEIHLLVIDLFPPSRRDPQGIHKAIWDELVEEPFELPSDKPLTLASYDAGPPQVAYVEPLGVADVLKEMPLFLRPGIYVPAPLEVTYQAAWAAFPAPLKGLLEG